MTTKPMSATPSRTPDSVAFGPSNEPPNSRLKSSPASSLLPTVSTKGW